MKIFKGRTAVVTGAGSGFGLEVARLAAREGMRVVMADVQPDALERAAATGCGSYRSCTSYRGRHARGSLHPNEGPAMVRTSRTN